MFRGVTQRRPAPLAPAAPPRGSALAATDGPSAAPAAPRPPVAPAPPRPPVVAAPPLPPAAPAPPRPPVAPAPPRPPVAPAPPRRRPRAARLAAATAGVLALALGAAAVARPPRPAGNPLVGLAPSDDDREPLVGRVVERLVAGSYTYVAIERADGRRAWAVTLGRAAPEGARVRVRSFGRRSNFYSARLGRTFPELIFGAVGPAA